MGTFALQLNSFQNLESQREIRADLSEASARLIRTLPVPLQVCGLQTARKITYDDPSAPHTPFLWCDECFKLMHYAANGQALYTNFKVFPYVHDYHSALMQAPGHSKPQQRRRDGGKERSGVEGPESEGGPTGSGG